VRHYISRVLAALIVLMGLSIPASAQAGSAPIRTNPDGKQVAGSAPLKANSKSMLPKGHWVPGRASTKTVNGYSYAGGYQYVSGAGSDGASAKVQVTNPFVPTTPVTHSLVEVAVQSADGSQAVEVGFRKGTSDPKQWLFAGHWINGVWQGYGTGFVADPAATHHLGDYINASASYPSTPVLWRIGIQQFDNVWWVGMDSTPGTFEWIGYFPNTRWTSQGATFTKMGLGQVFGEVPNAPNTADMGTGQFGRSLCCPVNTNLSAAYVNSWTLINPPTGVTHSLTVQETDPNEYRVGFTSSMRSFYYGGPGAGGNIGS